MPHSQHEQPWHAKALRLREQGATQEQIADAVDRSVMVVRRFLSPEAKRLQNIQRAKAYAARFRREPEFRERAKERNRRWRERERRKKSKALDRMWKAHRAQSEETQGHE